MAMEMAVRSMEMAETMMETDGDGSGGNSSSRHGAGTETSVPRNSSRISLSGRVPGRALGSSRSHDGDGGGLQYVSWKRDPSVRFFPSRETYRRKGIIRGGASWPHHGVARPGAGPRPPMVSLAPSPPSSHLRSS
jgi:hypothetical protein